jgi:hypothetical protein
MNPEPKRTIYRCLFTNFKLEISKLPQGFRVPSYTKRKVIVDVFIFTKLLVLRRSVADRYLLSFDADPYPGLDPTLHCRADPDPDPTPSLKIL